MKARRSVVIRSQLLPIALRVLRSAHLALPAGHDPDASEIAIELSALQEILESAGRRLGDDALGVSLAVKRESGSHGLIEFFWRSHDTVRDAALALGSLTRLVNDAARIELVEGPRSARIVQQIDGSPVGVGRHGNAFFVATLVRELRSLVDADFRPQRVLLAHDGPDPAIARLAEVVGCDEIELGADGTGIELATSWLDRPVRTADPSLARALRTHADTFLGGLRMPASESAVAQTRTVVLARLADAPALGEAAAVLGLSARSLQRHLAEEGASYQEVVDAVRLERAKELLVADQSIKQIASALGFSTERAFTRTFQRLAGSTPATWRRAAR